MGIQVFETVAVDLDKVVLVSSRVTDEGCTSCVLLQPVLTMDDFILIDVSQKSADAILKALSERDQK